MFPANAEGFARYDRVSDFLDPRALSNVIRMSAEGNSFAQAGVSSSASGLAASARSIALAEDRLLQVSARTQRLSAPPQTAQGSAVAFLSETRAIRVPFDLARPAAFTIALHVDGRVENGGSLEAGLFTASAGSNVFDNRRYDSLSFVEALTVAERIGRTFSWDAPPDGCVSADSPACLIMVHTQWSLMAFSGDIDATMSGLLFSVPDGFDLFSARGPWSGHAAAAIPVTGTFAIFVSGLAMLGLWGRRFPPR